MCHRHLLWVFAAILCASSVGLAEESPTTPPEPASLLTPPVECLRLDPLIRVGDSDTALFQWDARADTILKEEQQSRNEVAQFFINSGQWQRLLAECHSTETAQEALKKLDQAGLRVLPDGRVISQNVFVSVVPYTR